MEKFRLGICDDESEDLAQLLDMVKQYDGGGCLQAAAFSSAADILNAAKNACFDITILDIEMEPPTGFDVAKELIAMPNPPIVIFATNSKAYALKGYGIAIRYLQKPIAREVFFEAMDAAIADATAHRLTFQIKTEVARDAWLLQSGAVNEVQWHFYYSEASQTIGGSYPLIRALLDAGIQVYYH